MNFFIIKNNLENNHIKYLINHFHEGRGGVSPGNCSGSCFLSHPHFKVIKTRVEELLNTTIQRETTDFFS
jgi:hypothetical protein